MNLPVCSNADLIRRYISEVNWESKHIDDKVLIFNKTILNILSNFIPEITVYDDKNGSTGK